nr:hypothetical protein [Allomuricauda sp.]
MECKRVYDPVGSFIVDSKGNVHVNAILLLPLDLSNGRYQKLVVNKSKPINISDEYGHYGFLFIIECLGKPDSLKEEAVSDFLELDFTVKKEEIPNFPNGRFIRLIVIHNNEYMADPDNDHELVPCAKAYMKKVGFDPESSFDKHPDLPCVIPYGPQKSGESILPSI